MKINGFENCKFGFIDNCANLDQPVAFCMKSDYLQYINSKILYLLMLTILDNSFNKKVTFG